VPINNLLEPYHIRGLNLSDLETIAEFETRASDYSLFMTGRLPKPEDARNLFSPPQAKVFGVFFEQDLIGILQILNLEPEIEVIGLLLLEPTYRQAKLGTRVFEAYRSWAVTRGIQKVIVMVALEDTAANAFWLSLGFEMAASTPEPVLFGSKTHVMQQLELAFT
jgi:GNAT superfamily N-acetyltransferase